MASPGLKLPLKESSELEFGLPHDRFKLVRKLSNGGMGEVHLCKRLTNGDEFAVKIINRPGRALQTSPRHEVLLRREIRTLRELQHPNVVSLHDAFWEEGTCFIVMDLAHEGDLREKIARNVGLGSDAASSELASRYVARQLVCGIRYMHQRRVIHRDLKAENILVWQTRLAPGNIKYKLYDVKITDFGLSTWLDIVGELLTPCGTPNYLAPEIMKDNYDERIDFWSFGVVLYMMLCGDFPFDQYHNPADVEKILHQSIKRSGAWQQVSDQGKDFVCGLLVFDPDLRLSHGACCRHPWLADEEGLPSLEGTSLAGPRVESPSAASARAAAGAVQQISGWCGSAVDSLSVQWRDGSKHPHGGLGGWNQCLYCLAPDEVILAVSQETRSILPGHLGNSLVLFTSSCQVVAFQGADARSRSRFVAPPGSQIVGLQFVGSLLTGIHLERASEGGPGAVQVISGRVGYAVDNIVLQLRDGATRSYGGGGGFQQGPWTLSEDEYIVVVEQGCREEFLGNSIAFFTTAGKVYKLSGVEASSSRRFSAPPGRQICGLTFDADLLACVQTCPRHVSTPQAHELTLHDVSVV